MPNSDGLLSEDEVAARSGLAGPLVSELIPAVTSTFDSAGPDHAIAGLYDELGVLRSEVAKLLLDKGVRHAWVRFAVRESRTCVQLREALEELRRMPVGDGRSAVTGGPSERQTRRYLGCDRV